MSGSESTPHSGPHTPPDHELTGMETFFDNLFNHHMVLPQPPEDPHPIEGVDADQDKARENPGLTPV